MPWTPPSISGLVHWHRADLGVTTVSDKISAWADQSGNGRDLSQGTDANRPTLVADVINGKPVARFGPGFTANRWMDWSNFAHTSDETTFMVVKYVVSNSDYQIGIFGVSSLSRYLGGNGTNKPMIFDGSDRATWGTSLTDGTNYLVKWATKDMSVGPRTYFTQVNADPEVSEQVAGTLAVDSFNGLGIDPGVATSQDLVSDVAEVFTYNKILTASELAAVRAYVQERYAIYLKVGQAFALPGVDAFIEGMNRHAGEAFVNIINNPPAVFTVISTPTTQHGAFVAQLYNVEKNPMEIWAKLGNDPRGFMVHDGTNFYPPFKTLSTRTGIGTPLSPYVYTVKMDGGWPVGVTNLIYREGDT